MTKNLKFILLIVVLATLVMFACRKETEKQTTYIDKPAHCYNLVKDSDETYIDCGGACGACNVPAVLTSNCTCPNYTVQANLVNLPVSSAGRLTNVSGNYEYTLNIAGGSLKVITMTGAPIGTDLQVVTTSQPSATNEVVVLYTNGGPTANLTTGNVQIRQSTSGLITETYVDICNGVAPGPVNIKAFAKVN